MEGPTPTIKQLAQKAIKSNLTIQNTLTTKVAELEAQLQQLDELIDSVHKGVATEEVPEDAFEGEIQIPGAKRANGLIPSFELLNQSSPFYKEASQRAHYVRWTSVHPIKGREAEILAEAVKKENMRLEAYRARNSPTAPPIDIENNIDGINWSIVAEKVSDNSSIKRTPDECRIQWVGNLHPKINHGDWTQDELNKLHQLISSALAGGEKPNWARIAKELGTNRIPIDCMKKATTRPRHHWDADADQRLRKAVQKFGTDNWNVVARFVSPYVTTSQCQTRYFRSVDSSIKRGPWTPDEDTRLRKGVEAFRNSWIDIASVLPGRTNEQCRERWAEVGGEGGKGLWSAEEDEKLLEAVKELGNKWKIVSTRVGGGRTGPNCRLRHDRLMKIRAKQAEANATVPVQPSSLGTSTAPASAGAGESVASTPHSPVSVPAPAPTKPRTRKKSKVAPPAESSATVNAGPSTLLEPAVARPRPRPRPIYKGKEKERANEGEGVEGTARAENQAQETQDQTQVGDTDANVPGSQAGNELCTTELPPELARDVGQLSDGASTSHDQVQPKTYGQSGKRKRDLTKGDPSPETPMAADLSAESERQPSKRSSRKKQKTTSMGNEGEEGGPKDTGMGGGVTEKQVNSPGGRGRGRRRGRGGGGRKGRGGERDGSFGITPVGEAAEGGGQQDIEPGQGDAVENVPPIQNLEPVPDD